MTVVTPISVRRQFSTNAKTAYPNENFAFLLGSIEGDVYKVQKLYFPPIKTTPDKVIFNIPKELKIAKSMAETLGLELLGDIHSHPGFYDTSPSELDWDNTSIFMNYYVKSPIMGIVGVYKAKNGKLRTRLRYWSWIKEKICQKS